MATKSHAHCGSKNDLSFEKGDDIELYGSTDFGYLIGRTGDGTPFGLFPEDAGTAVIVKKFSLRTIRKNLRRKKSGRVTSSGSLPAAAAASAAAPAVAASPKVSPEKLLPPASLLLARPDAAVPQLVPTPRGLAPALPPMPATASHYVQDEAALTSRLNLQKELSATDSEEDSVESQSEGIGGWRASWVFCVSDDGFFRE